MKKLLTFVVIIAALAAGIYYFRSHGSPGQVSPGTATDKTFQPDASSATFTFDDSGSTVTLSHGGNSLSDPNTGLVQDTKLLSEKAAGDLNGDGKIDEAVLLSQSGGGTGVFIYVAAYVSGPVSYKGTNTILIGDRISPQKVSVDNGVITVSYLDRKPGEPFAAEPTVPTTKQFVYSNGELQSR